MAWKRVKNLSLIEPTAEPCKERKREKKVGVSKQISAKNEVREKEKPFLIVIRTRDGKKERKISEKNTGRGGLILELVLLG